MVISFSCNELFGVRAPGQLLSAAWVTQRLSSAVFSPASQATLAAEDHRSGQAHGIESFHGPGWEGVHIPQRLDNASWLCAQEEEQNG